MRALAGALGIAVRRRSGGSSCASRAGAQAARVIDGSLAPGEVALLTGPSGSGKTTLLRTFRRRARLRGQDLVSCGAGARSSRADAPVIDRLPGVLAERMALLGACGLAEASVLLMRERDLSFGQHARFSLALALASASARACAGRRVGVVIDDFGAGLDGFTARSLARTLARWLASGRAGGLRVVVATTRDDLAGVLLPSILVTHALLSAPIVTFSPGHAAPGEAVGEPAA